jgi:hypothetical protein
VIIVQVPKKLNLIEKKDLVGRNNHAQGLNERYTYWLSVELEDQDIDLADLDDAYEQDLDQDSYQNDEQAKNAQQQLQQPTI